MAGPVRPAQAISQALHPNGGRETRRVDLGCRRHKDKVNPCRPEHCKIGRLAPRIGGEVFTGPELCRIDKDRRDDALALGLRCPDQRQMTVVQRAHRRHQADPLTGFSPPGDVTAQIDDGAYDVQPTPCPERYPFTDPEVRPAT